MSLIVGNCLFSFVQECHIHDFFMKRCSGRVKVKLNLNRSLVFSVIRNTLSEQNLVYTRRAEMLLTRNYTGLWFLLHVMRGEKEKQLILARDCANRQRPLPTYLATTRAIYQGTEAGQSACRGLGAILRKQAKTVKILLACTRKPRKP